MNIRNLPNWVASHWPFFVSNAANRRLTTIRASAVFLVVAAAGLAISAARGAVPTTAPQNPPVGSAPQYRVLFSRSDKVCNVLAGFYTHHLRDPDSRTAGYIEDRFGRELRGSGVEFLAERNDWRPQSNYLWTQSYPSVDVYNDGSARAVILADSSLRNDSFGTFSTTIIILKQGKRLTDLPGEALFQLNGRHEPAPAIEQWIDLGVGGSSLAPQRAPYVIIEIPPRPVSAAPNVPPLPPAMGQARQRLIRSGNTTYGVARSDLTGASIDNFIRSGAFIIRNPILVYSMSQIGKINDICFLEVAFTLPRG